MRRGGLLGVAAVALACGRAEKAPPRPVAEAASSLPAPAPEAAAPPRRPRVQLFYPGWVGGALPPSALDLAGIDDVVLFGAVPAHAGDVDLGPTSLRDADIRAMRAVTRAAGVGLLLCVGGEKTGPAFAAAFAAAGPEGLARAIVARIARHELDGVVLDVEPLATTPPDGLAAFVRSLRATTRRLEVVVAPDRAELAAVSDLAASFERIAIMSYMASLDEDAERALAAAIPGRELGWGVDARTRREDVSRRLRGDVVLWHAGTLCRRSSDGGLRATCRVGP